ncbi:alpha-N-arabinofuranosidase [Paenibacillus algorifonticola]|uniref:Alpha-N-arabinofuranosidase n=1 Tax=Paenibacillus algorifonticola TaxID=684063 RepID=A0A1I2CEX2_9BACL|nr:glycoside hydrolase family 43 protein [Paenibacillus algorifonticola]SFE66655.1 alpha-N-arabinofuranosidase [Paenibacillus algorifonticola]
MRFTNPVLSGFYPDPSVCRVGGDFYLVTSSFEYFPGVPIFHSTDMVNWRQLGHCLTRENQLPLHGSPSSRGIFAPTIRYNNGRFYMITTNVTVFKNFYVWADSPEGPWSDPVWLDEWPGIDPSLMFDEDGKVYITGTSVPFSSEPLGIYQSELDIESGRLIGKRKFIWQGTGGSFPEGPHLYRIGDWYYLIIAEGGTEYGHMVTAARSKAPFGPFESCPHNPILTQRSTDSPIQATGHAELVQISEREWWAVFLGIRPVGYPAAHHLGRETFGAPVTWTEDGWPIIGHNGRAAVELDAPALPPSGQIEWREQDDFNEPELALYWNFLRNPGAESWSLAERPGWLTLHGSAHALDDTQSPAFVGRRQQHFQAKWSTLLEFQPQHDGEEAGLTVLMNERYHYEIALTRLEGTKQVILRRRIGSLWKIEQAAAYNDAQIELSIEADAAQYTFAFSAPGGQPHVLGTGECAMLSKEVAGGFTGVYTGLYATGNGKNSTVPAYFDWFKYEVKA